VFCIDIKDSHPICVLNHSCHLGFTAPTSMLDAWTPWVRCELLIVWSPALVQNLFTLLTILHLLS